MQAMILIYLAEEQSVRHNDINIISCSKKFCELYKSMSLTKLNEGEVSSRYGEDLLWWKYFNGVNGTFAGIVLENVRHC